MAHGKILDSDIGSSIVAIAIITTLSITAIDLLVLVMG